MKLYLNLVYISIQKFLLSILRHNSDNRPTCLLTLFLPKPRWNAHSKIFQGPCQTICSSIVLCHSESRHQRSLFKCWRNVWLIIQINTAACIDNYTWKYEYCLIQAHRRQSSLDVSKRVSFIKDWKILKFNDVMHMPYAKKYKPAIATHFEI